MKIKRPLFVIAVSMLVVICAINTMPGSILYVSLALFVIFMIFHKLTLDRYTEHIALFLLAALIAAGYLGLFRDNMNARKDELLRQDSVTITGEVTRADTTSWSNCYHVKSDTINGEKVRNFSVVVYTDDYFTKGDVVTLTGKLSDFTPTSNYLYNYSQGVFLSLSCEKAEIHSESTTFTGFFADIQTKLVDRARKIFSYKTAPVAVAMGLGDKSFISGEINDAFKVTGISHALSVSGLHAGFIVSVISGLLYFIPVRKKVKNIVTSLFVVCFMAIIGFTPSIIRAGMLVITVLLGRNLIVETDNYTVLAIVIILTLISNPYSANNGSLLLSYSAYFGVIQVVEICSSKEWGKGITAFMISVFAVLYTCPVVAILDMHTTWLSPVFNFILSPVLMIVCVLSFFLPVISFIPVIGNIAVLIFAPVNNLLIMFLIKFTTFVKQHFAFAYIDLSEEKIKVIIFAVAVAVIVAFIQLTDKKDRIIFIITVSILLILCYNYLNRDVAVVKAFDGSSEPSYIVTYKDENYLIATENINENRFKEIAEQLKIENFDEIICCMKTDPDIEFYSGYSDTVKVVTQSGVYGNDVITIDAQINDRRMAYIMNIGGFTMGFSHNKADLSQNNMDLYFFGSDKPADFRAAGCYYFYPVIKVNKEMANEKQATELYDVLTIKVKLSDGSYSIVKDVKNFGNQLQNHR